MKGWSQFPEPAIVTLARLVAERDRLREQINARPCKPSPTLLGLLAYARSR